MVHAKLYNNITIIAMFCYPGDNDSITCSTTTPPTMHTATTTATMSAVPTTTPPTTHTSTATTTPTKSAVPNSAIEVREIVVISVLGIVILALIIIIVPIVYKLCYLNRYDNACSYNINFVCSWSILLTTG